MNSSNATEPSISELMQQHMDNLTKPVGSFGNLEQYALKLSEIQQRVPPSVGRKAVFVFAGDHGITEEKVSLYPREVTCQMVLNFIGGGAAINVLARHCGFDVSVVDAGVDADLRHAKIIDKKVARGTRNFLNEPAMSEEQLSTCLENGRALAEKAVREKYDLVALGDMGIGNTSSAAALLIASGFKPEDVVDRGTGISTEALDHKRQTIMQAVRRHTPFGSPRTILQRLGGFELCAIAGFILALRERGVACIIDGFPVSTAAYMAFSIDNSITSFIFAGHRSKVRGHARILEAMGMEPILDLGMRLGEGTGAVLGGQVVDLSAKLAGEMASFDSARVSRSEEIEENY